MPTLGKNTVAAKASPATASKAAELAHAKAALVQLQAIERAAPAGPKRVAAQQAVIAQAQVVERLLASVKALTGQAKRGSPAGTVVVSPAAVPTRKLAVAEEKAQVKAKTAELQTALRKDLAPEIKQQLVETVSVLQARSDLLKQREGLLAKGLDIDAPTKLAPAQIVTPRPPLVLPPVYTLPSLGVRVALLRGFAHRLPRRPGESNASYHARLVAYTKRGLVRLLSVPKGTPTEQVVPTVIEQTVREDAPSLESEADAGGVAADPVADSVDMLMLDIAADVEETIAEVAPAVSTEFDPSTIDSLILESDSVEAALMQPAAVPPFEATPIYKKPVFWVAAAGAAAALYWASTRK